jgi:alpha-L-rhamnosidase
MLACRIGRTLAAGVKSLKDPVSAAEVQEDGLLVDGLQVDGGDDPLGIDSPRPRLSWRLNTPRREARQTAWEIEAFNDRDREVAAWATGKVSGFDCINLAYGGPPLQSRDRLRWRVRVWDETDRCSPWSEWGHWEMGLLSPQDWAASWISPGEGHAGEEAAPLLGRPFEVDGEVVRARAYVTSLGLYELHLNDARAGDQLLTPGWTSYGSRLQYQTYDVTGLIRQGANTVSAFLAEGWRRGRLNDRRSHYGNALALRLQLEIELNDGRRQVVCSDEDWKSCAGPIVQASLYDGETYDARLETPAWAVGLDDPAWAPVALASRPTATLVAGPAAPVREIETLSPKRLFRSPSGMLLIDMGQNMAGWIRLRADGPPGATITLRHGEILDGAGELYRDNLRAARQTVTYILRGDGPRVFEPRFSFQGFRYVQVDGFPGTLDLADIEGAVIHSDTPVAGDFRCSNPLIDQLQSNIVWSQRGNFIEIPTDCPQRDERLGWTGDAQVFFSTAAFNMKVDGFFRKWLRDLAAEQDASGAIPWTVPDVLGSIEFQGEIVRAAGAAGWGDAATIIPWGLYLEYGDPGVLADQYESMAQWVAYESACAGEDHVWRGDQFGDWLDYFSANQDPPVGGTPSDLVATAFYARSLSIMTRAARVLGKTADEARYAALLRRVRAAFQAHFIAPDGSIEGGTQAAYVLALDFDLVPTALRTAAAQALADDVSARGHLTTGFLGTPRLLHVLSRFGHLDLAYRLLMRTDCPSWLYPVTRGATTIWERWDGIRPDGSLAPASMNSFNHYAYGAVGDWLYRCVAGIDLDEEQPAYRHVRFQPRPGGGLTEAEASHCGPYGLIRSHWRRDGDFFTLNVQAPPNTSGTVWLPRAGLATVTEGGRPLHEAAGVGAAVQQDDDVRIEVGSGAYEFTYPMRGSS